MENTLVRLHWDRFGRTIMSGIRPIVTKPCGKTLVGSTTVPFSAATAHVESLVPRGGHADTELDSVNLSTHTYALVDLAIDKAMLWQTLGSRGKDADVITTLFIVRLVNALRELQPIIGVR